MVVCDRIKTAVGFLVKIIVFLCVFRFVCRPANIDILTTFLSPPDLTSPSTAFPALDLSSDDVDTYVSQLLHHCRLYDGGDPNVLWKVGITNPRASLPGSGDRWLHNVATWGNGEPLLDYLATDVGSNAIAILVEEHLCNLPGFCRRACPCHGPTGNPDTHPNPSSVVYVFRIHDHEKRKCGSAKKPRSCPTRT